MLFKPGDKVRVIKSVTAGDVVEGICLEPEVTDNNVKTIKEFVPPRSFSVQEDSAIYPEPILRHLDSTTERARTASVALQNQLDAKKWYSSQDAQGDMSGRMFYCYSCPYASNYQCTKTDVRTILCLCAGAYKSYCHASEHSDLELV